MLSVPLIQHRTHPILIMKFQQKTGFLRGFGQTDRQTDLNLYNTRGLRYARRQCTSQYHLSRYALDRRFAPGMNAAVSTSHVSCQVSDEIAPVGPLRRRCWARPRCGTRTDVVHARRQAETTSKLIIGYVYIYIFGAVIIF